MCALAVGKYRALLQPGARTARSWSHNGSGCCAADRLVLYDFDHKPLVGSGEFDGILIRCKHSQTRQVTQTEAFHADACIDGAKQMAYLVHKRSHLLCFW